jgi:hypothetical protein
MCRNKLCTTEAKKSNVRLEITNSEDKIMGWMMDKLQRHIQMRLADSGDLLNA